MAEKVKLGFIGCGGVQQKHMEDIALIEDATMTAFCDLNEELAQQSAKQYGGKAFTDYKALLEEELDAVYIAVPPNAHGMELDVMAKDLPFFVEKPVGMDLGLLREIAAEVEKKNHLTSVGYMSRYREGVQKAKAMLQEDPAVMAYGGWIGGTPKMTAPIHSWWVVKEKSGGQLVEQTTHTVDLIRYLCGEVVEVYAAAAKGFVKNVQGYTIDDASLATLKFENGAIATLFSACCANAGGGGVSLKVYALNHTVSFAGWALDAEIMETGKEPVKIKGEPNAFEFEDRAFIKAVKTGDRSGILTDYPDGVKTAHVTIAANESMETGKPVSLK